MKHPMIPKVTEQLKSFMYELTVEIPKALEFALSLGDLSENAEYEMTKDRQLFVESRVKQLEELLRRLQNTNLDHLPKDRIAYGSRVKVEDLDTEEQKQFLIVFPGEDPDYRTDADTLVTLASPVGQALYGKKVGDEVTVRIPKGTYDWEIIEMQTFYELMNNSRE